MDYEQIAYDLQDGIATITLDRPDRLNAFTDRMAEELLHARDRVAAAADVRAVIFTGRGRAYCAGADLGNGTEIFERDPSGQFVMERDADYGGVIARRLFESTKPLIGAITGAAVGIGVSSTLPMDVRLASEHARFGFVFARRGLVPEACSSWFLPRIVGISQAAEWVFSGRIFGAEEALKAGLVRGVHPADELLGAARELARSMTESTAPVAVALSRRMLWQMLGEPSPAVAHEIDSRGIFFLGRSDDVKEGVAAFLEKRPAAFPLRVSTDMPEFFREWQQTGDARALLADTPVR